MMMMIVGVEACPLMRDSRSTNLALTMTLIYDGAFLCVILSAVPFFVSWQLLVFLYIIL